MIALLLIGHIVIALSSITYSVYLFLQPSKRKFNVTYGLIGSTFATGTVLVIATHSSLTSACIAGITYLAVVMVAIIPARYRFKKLQTQEIDKK